MAVMMQNGYLDTITDTFHFVAGQVETLPRRMSSAYIRETGLECLQTLEIARTDITGVYAYMETDEAPTDGHYVRAHHYAPIIGATPVRPAPVTTDTEIWLRKRAFEHALFETLGRTMPRQVRVMVTWAKRDKATKHVAGVSAFTGGRGVWYDLTEAGLERRGVLNAPTISDQIARALVKPAHGWRVYSQTLIECLRDARRRVPRMYAGVRDVCPHDRKVAPFV